MKRALLLPLSLLLATSAVAQQHPAAPHDMEHMQNGGFMQGGMHHEMAQGVTLTQKTDSVTHKVTLRIGPMNLPANTSHMKMPQPPNLYWTIPFDGWLLAYEPRLVNAKGETVPGTVLHHVAFWNENRADFLCPNKDEHIFGAGGELTHWTQITGYGYRVHAGDRIRIETMVHNPTATSYSGVYLEVVIPYTPNAFPEPLKTFYPAWMDVASCGNSGYDLPAGPSAKTGEVTVKYSGMLLGVGGHMHDYAKRLVLEDATKKETIATLDAVTDASGRLKSIPVMTFYQIGGKKLAAGDQLKVTATYDNTTGKMIPQGAMGIVVGYFVPDDDSAFAALRHAARSRQQHPMHHMGQTTSHDASAAPSR